MTKKVPVFLIVGIMAAILLFPATIMNSPAEAIHQKRSVDFEPRLSSGDTIGNIQIRSVFYFADGTEVVDSFRIFNQMQGYDTISKPMFELTGGVGSDKQMLYHVTDFAHHTRHDSSQSKFTNFDIDVYLMNGADVYRRLAYSNCDVNDYKVLTLHDGDETFSGKTKFVIADQFIFECDGFHPHCPSCENTGDATTRSKTKSTLDYNREQQLMQQIYPDLN
jgi:hypothetical protein